MSSLNFHRFHSQAEGDGFYPRGRHQHLLFWFVQAYCSTLKNALKSVPSVNKKIKTHLYTSLGFKSVQIF